MTLEAPRVLAQNLCHRRDERNQPDGPGASTCRPRRSEPRRPRGLAIALVAVVLIVLAVIAII